MRRRANLAVSSVFWTPGIARGMAWGRHSGLAAFGMALPRQAMFFRTSASTRWMMPGRERPWSGFRRIIALLAACAKVARQGWAP